MFFSGYKAKLYGLITIGLLLRAANSILNLDKARKKDFEQI